MLCLWCDIWFFGGGVVEREWRGLGVTKQNELLISLGWQLVTALEGLEAAEENASQNVVDLFEAVRRHKISLAEKFDDVLIRSIFASGLKGEADKVREIIRQMDDLLSDDILQSGDLDAKVVYLRDVRGLGLSEIAEILGRGYGYVKNISCRNPKK